jgi:hypothetical protein
VIVLKHEGRPPASYSIGCNREELEYLVNIAGFATTVNADVQLKLPEGFGKSVLETLSTGAALP